MRPLLLILFALLLAACADPHTDRRLARAEALMMTAPDSAATVLDSINPTRLRGHRAALHALLRTHANYRNYITDTDDSLINIAVDYFTSHPDPARLMVARYCQGRVLDNAHRYSEAMTAALTALDLATALNDPFYQARAHELMGDLWDTENKYDKASRCYQSASILYKSLNLTQNHLWALNNVANCLYNLRKYNDAVHLADSINGVTQNDKCLRSTNNDLIGRSMMMTGEYTAAVSIFQELADSNPTATNLLLLAEALALKGNLSSAMTAYQMGTEALNDNSTSDELEQKLNAEYLLAKGGGDMDSVAAVTEKCFNRMHKQQQSHGISDAEADFIAKKHSTNERLASAQKAVFLAVLLLILTISALAVPLYLDARFKDEKEKKALLNKAIKLRKKLKESTACVKDRERLIRDKDRLIKTQDATITHLQNSDNVYNHADYIDPTIDSKLTILSQLCDEILINTNDEGRLKSGIYRKVIKILEDIRSTRFTKKLDERIDLATKGLVSHFKAAVNKHTHADYLIFLYSAAGLSVSAISVILNEPTQTVYSRRNRLRTKINKLNCPRTEDMSQILT